MSVKLKIFIVLALSIFATAVVIKDYTIKQWDSNTAYTVKEQQPFRAHEISQNVVVNSYREKYNSIPLTQIKTLLKGTDPAAIAINAFNPNHSKQLHHEVDVVYPQPNQAMVTIIQTNLAASKPKPMKYRVELTSFGRSLFVTSPPLWQIVWAGTYEECLPDKTSTAASKTC